MSNKCKSINLNDLFNENPIDNIDVIDGVAYYQGVPYSGRYTTKHKNGNIKVNGYYINGLKEFAWTEFYYNQQRKTYINYKDGLRQGFSVKWHPFAETFGCYEDDKKDGIWYEYIGNRLKPKRKFYVYGFRQFTIYPFINNTIMFGIFCFLIYRKFG